MKIKEYLQNINIKKITKKSLDFLYWRISWVLILLFVLLSLYCVYVWYDYIYNPSWNNQKREEYIKSKGEGITFDKNNFSRIVSEQKRRIDNYNENITDVEDIFRLKSD